MTKLKHLWEVNQFITKLNCPQAKTLQTFYIEKCKKLYQGGELPAQNFGPSAMCSYCGSLWKTTDYTIRISRGRSLPKSIKKIQTSQSNENKVIPKVRRNLLKKCLKGQMNKLILKCTVCLKSTEIAFNKPPRLKMAKPTECRESIKTGQKRKKKTSKDKTAGLNISLTTNINAENDVQESKEKNSKGRKSNQKCITPGKEMKKKLNINRLKWMVNNSSMSPKRRSLHNFLQELC